MWPEMGKDLGLDESDYAIMLNVFMISYALGKMLSGKLFDLIGSRMGFVVSIVVWSGASVLHAFARGLVSLTAFRALLGLGEAGNWPGAVKSNGEWFPVHQRAIAQGIFNAGASLGSVIAPVLIAYLYGHFGWRTTYIIIGAIGVLWVIPWLFINNATPDKNSWITEEEKKMILSSREALSDDKSDDVVIGDTHDITVGNGVHAQMNNLAVGGNGASIIQSAGSSMTVTGNITLERSQDGYVFAGTTGVDMGTLIYSGLPVTKADGTSSPRVRITQKLPDANQWHLFSYGFKQSRLAEIFADEHYRVSTTSGNEGNLAFATYDGSAASGSIYSYPYTSTTAAAISNADANIVVDGKGYSINTADGETDVRWRARIQTDDVSIDISDAGDQFNLVGNPYPAYLHANTAADATNNLLTVNSAVLDEATIWLWDAAGSNFVTKNLGDASFRVNPMQGFFVKAKSAGGTSQSFSFTENMQSHTSTNTFFRSSNQRFEVDLSITNGELNRSTSIRYMDNMTTSFDNGYDSSMFGGYSTGLAVYTNLVEGDFDKKLAIQSLPNENFESMVIPVGVNAEANSEITFSTEALNIPTGYKVFLEDRVNNTFTRLDEADAAYTATVSETSTDGRFFLHTTTSVLSVESELLNSVSVYKRDASTLKIVGLPQGNTSVKLYTILGENVMSANFNTTGVKEISLPKLSQGVYIVQLETETGKLNKKIVLE